MTLGVAYQAAAGLAYRQAKGDMASAVTLFRSYMTGAQLDPPANLYNYVQTWGPRLTDDGEISGRATHAGRPAMLSPQMVEECYTAIINGKPGTRPEPFESPDDIQENCPVVIRVLDETGASLSTLLKRVQELHPGFGRRLLHNRWALTPANCQDRKRICEALLRLPESELDRVVFIDAKTIWMAIKRVYGYVDTDTARNFEHTHPSKWKGQIIKIKYYAAVHSKLGPVWIRFYTGTTGMPAQRDGHHYKVSSGNEKLGGLAGCHMDQSFFQLGSPFTLTGQFIAALTHTQP